MEENNMIRVLHVDDSLIFKKAIESTLAVYSNICFVGNCKDGSEVVTFVEENEIDVILMDVSMKIMGGIEATKLVKETSLNLKIIALSSHNDEATKMEMLSAGAEEYLCKYEITPKELHKTIITVLNR